MTIRLLSLLLLFVMLGAARQPVKLVRAGERIEWSMGEGRKVYRLGGMTAMFDRVQCAPLGEDCEEGHMEPKLVITAADGKSVTLDGSPMQNILMLGPLSKGGPVAAFVQTYSGGMHCCQEMRAVVPGADGLKVVELGAYDGAEIGWPKDIDKDGTLDFVVSDDRFLYAFESYAGSVAPPMVLNVIDGAKVDVSADPRFRKIFEKAAAETRKGCIKEEYPNGACAAWAANAARLGQLEAAMPVILKEIRTEPKIWPDKCKVARDPENGACPDGQLIEYPDYAAGLRAYLAELGYTPPA
ncbi:hypothetical protein [Sphingomonas sp. LT1P40]|uniref:hypothetical protein n=1 Tax=Alteristakelama amylovorans TaxID=3096166 RepID=UPI002FC78709